MYVYILYIYNELRNVYIYKLRNIYYKLRKYINIYVNINI